MKNPKALETLLTGILVLGILPSWTSLTAALAGFLSLFQWTGPLNPLKIGLPVLGLWLLLNRRAIDLPIKTVLTLFTIYVIFSITAVFQCEIPPMRSQVVRDSFIFIVGFFYALGFFLLRYSHQKVIIFSWFGIVFGLALLDLVSPSVTQLFLNTIFDPRTTALDANEIGFVPLTGVWGRQSLAKLLAWLPWIALAAAAPKDLTVFPKKSFLILSVLSVVSFSLILPTSQRGPLLGTLIGITGFVVALIKLQRLSLRPLSKKTWLSISAGLLVFATLTVAFTPRSILESRVLSLLGQASDSPGARSAQGNISFRRQMTSFSLQVILENPLGKACISDSEFLVNGISHFSHSHNLLIHQFRDRGWIWGAIHLMIWIFALLAAWRLHTLQGAILFGGIVSVIAGGMFDHPWNVLNHSVVLWVMLLWLPLKRKNH